MLKSIFTSRLKTSSFTSYSNKTRFAIIWASIFNEPFSALYPILPLILLRDLGATAFQIVILTILKPIVSLFSFYWSAKIDKRPDKIRTNLLGAGILARLPFFISIFFDSVWMMIAAAAIYMLFSRACIPAWMEILKRNMPEADRHRYFSLGSAIGYAEGILIAIGVGMLLDAHMGAWKALFLIGTFLGLISLFIQCSVPINGEGDPLPDQPKENLKELFLKPWKDSWYLLRNKPDFMRFQLGFMAGGFGLMLLQPVVPIFFDQVLHLSYTKLMVAYSICKGLGFVVTSPLWGRFLHKIPSFQFTSLVLIGFALYPLLLSLAQLGYVWVYVAFLFYGIAQAGSHLIWHLSGPLFAKEEDSSKYSGVNVVMVGLRGVIAPAIGGIFTVYFGPVAVFITSVLLCILGIFPLFYKRSSSRFFPKESSLNDSA